MFLCSGSRAAIASHDTPDSNHTSTMSFSRSSWLAAAPPFLHTVPGRATSAPRPRPPRVGALALEDLRDVVHRVALGVLGAARATIEGGDRRARHEAAPVRA